MSNPPRATRPGRAAELARARDYPYAIPRRSFVYRDSGIDAFDSALCRDRTPVLAIGSNQSPDRLAQKFGDDASHVIPVQRTRLQNFDVVYAAHISSYGAVPAMLQVSEGSEVELAVTWLNDGQLQIMTRSEVYAANYALAVLDGLRLRFEGGGETSRAYAYVSRRGSLRHAEGALALAAIGCRGRRFPATSTHRALEVVRMRVAPDMPADAFVLALIDDQAFRQEVASELSEDAIPFNYGFELAE